MNEAASKEFTNFANAAAPTSPLYGFLAERAAQDEALCDLLSATPEPKRTGVLFFGAMHFLVLQGASNDLRSAFKAPNEAVGSDSVFNAFRSLARERRDDILEIMQSRSVQTNEVNRCMALATGLSTIGSDLGTFTLVDVGSSAGINLCYDRYSYTIGDSTSGNTSSDVRLSSDLRGNLIPPLLRPLPQPAVRLGIDIEPIDPTNEAATQWLFACLWPGDARRPDRLRGALEITRSQRPTVLQADAIKALPDIDITGSLVAFSSWIMSWLTPEHRQRLLDVFAELSRQRPVWLITLENTGVLNDAELDDPLASERPSVIALSHFSNGQRESKVLAVAQHHCQWMAWRDEQTAR